MRMRTAVLAASALVALFAGFATATPGHGHGGSGGAAKGKPTKGKSVLAPPSGSATTDDDAGVVDAKFFPAKGGRVERSWLRFKLRHLDAGATYTIWADNPADANDDTTLTQIATTSAIVTSDTDGVNVMFDTKHGDTLPFGATLADLAGKAVQVRDAGGTTALLVGTLPTLK